MLTRKLPSEIEKKKTTRYELKDTHSVAKNFSLKLSPCRSVLHILYKGEVLTSFNVFAHFKMIQDVIREVDGGEA